MTTTKPKKKTWKPTPPVPCICGDIHRHHIEALAPVGMTRRLALDGVAEHELVGIDGSAQLCSCGARHTSHVEHLADITLGAPSAAA